MCKGPEAEARKGIGLEPGKGGWNRRLEREDGALSWRLSWVENANS